MRTRAAALAKRPSREDVLSIDERMTQMEMRLDDIDAKLDLALGRPAATSPASAPVSPARASVKKRAGADRKHKTPARKR